MGGKAEAKPKKKKDFERDKKGYVPRAKAGVRRAMLKAARCMVEWRKAGGGVREGDAREEGRGREKKKRGNGGENFEAKLLGSGKSLNCLHSTQNSFILHSILQLSLSIVSLIRPL